MPQHMMHIWHIMPSILLFNVLVVMVDSFFLIK